MNAKSLPVTYFNCGNGERHRAHEKEPGHSGGLSALSLLAPHHGQAERHSDIAGADAGKKTPTILANWPGCARGYGRAVTMAEMHHGRRHWGKMTQCHNGHASALTQSHVLARSRAAASSGVHPAGREGFVAWRRAMTTAFTLRRQTGGRLIKGYRSDQIPAARWHVRPVL
jgi:hypothetical protein